MKPTENEIRELWEGCGFVYEEIQGFSRTCPGKYWKNSDDTYCEKTLPPIDLNNLFSYALPKAELSIKKHRCFATLMLGWLGEVLRGEDPALSLFWAIYPVIKEVKGG